MENNESFFSRFLKWVDGESSQPPQEHSEKVRKTHNRRRRIRSDEEREKVFNRVYSLVAVAVSVIFVAVMMFTVFNLPLFGEAESPAMNEVVQRYVENGLEETGSVNMVTGMILDYRAFDTFGESSVLFIAVTCVMMLLLSDRNNIDEEEERAKYHEFQIEHESQDMILQKVIGIVFPCIMMFGVYVVLNGHLSPGGGFSGGAIMGGALIVFRASFGYNRLKDTFNMKTFRTISACALLTYGCSKAYSFFTGANGLPTGIPLGTPGAILSSGLILVLDICVGCVVACTMYGFYALMLRGEI